ncbi:Nse1 non-SMC component of SMC5-6 complex-domain-containing protein [Panaeolus papilionaceus]|nr:Nse1 non-SMC component of SMC5-6 complex-domain-containing protein [Panaeolus papilionaceus]
MPISESDVEKLFLQAVLSRGIVSTKLAKILWKKSREAVKGSCSSVVVELAHEDTAFVDFAQRISTSLDKLDLEFRCGRDETSGVEMWAIVNRKEDEISKMATEYTPTEITFFKLVVEQIMLAPRESFSVSSLAAMREASNMKPNMTKSQAEVTLASFVAKGWLLKSSRGRYSLSTRAILELGVSYLKSEYPDEIIECTICLELMTRGIACHTPNCKIRMHTPCFMRFRRDREICPSCGANWPREPKNKPLIPIGEEAAKKEDDLRRRTRQTSQESDEEDGDEEEPATQEQDDEGTPAPSHKKSGRLHKKATMEDADGDQDMGDTQPSQTQKTRSRRR